VPIFPGNALSMCRRTGAAVAALALISVLTASVGGEASGHDAGAVDANAFPWSAVSKIYNSARASCTGAVIAPNKALTAAHCLFNRATHRFLPTDSLHLLLGYDHGEYRVHARVASYVVAPGYQPENNPAGSLLHDWALLMLTEPVAGDTTPLALATRPARAGERIMIGGFSRQSPFKMTADTDCRMRDVMQSGLLVHDCAVMPGDSGAPLLSRDGEKDVQIIGIQIGSGDWMGSKAGFAVPLSGISQALVQH